ncbi:MAG: SDR family NAD(P)-dependent oxidoreductase [Streptosporangiaceae bacterium]|nr:SDR family NAD(P)-dependent oxidoreductase [Streptosporangiaceae bacterium]
MAEISEGSLTGTQSVVHRIREHARRTPERTALVMLPDGESEAERVSFGELDRRARSFAAFLRAREGAGERVLLLLPQGTGYVTAFLGCLYAGAVAVPGSVPARGRQTERIAGIIADCAPQMVVTVRAKAGRIQQMLPAGCTAVGIEDIPESSYAWEDPGIEPDRLAYLQYTSGSTSQPRGVRVSHRNLVYQCRMLEGGVGVRADEVMVSWLPLFHDMGLIGGLLLPLSVGAAVVLMPPMAFVQAPLRWLAAISRYRATATFVPNFALALCCEKVTEEDRRRLDLSCLRAIVVGAEPVRAETLEAFAAAFGPVGAGFQTLVPGYGLAEATLAVCIHDRSTPAAITACDADELGHGRLTPAPPGSARTQRLVGVGRPLLDTEVVIVTPASGHPCPEGTEGEIWVRGETVTAGYRERADETASVFGARLPDGRGPFLRTGDLGVRYGGNVYITGRLKDLIIIHGLNHHPHDIERTAGDAHPALATDRGAAFSVTADGGEQLVIVHELKLSDRRAADPEAVAKSIRLQVTSEHDLAPAAVILIRPGSLPMTTSGKVRRNECRQLYLDGLLAVEYTWRGDAAPAAPAGYAAVTGWLVARIAALKGLPLDEVAVDAPFASFGIDSVTLVGISGDLQGWLGRRVDPLCLYDHPTIARLARFISCGEPAARLEDGARTSQPVAVVGMACEFPGARSADEFWDLLVHARDAVGTPPRPREGAGPDGDGPAERSSADAPRGGFINGIDEFDAGFFGVSAAEARVMDPQQRLLLTVTWRALEDAAIPPGSIAGSNAGVFVGISGSDYRQLMARDRAEPDGYAGTGNALSIAANRISYFFDLRGPSQAVDTACSSSLVALHQAVASLRLGECDLAIVGGVNLLLDPGITASLSQAGMLAPDGRCKTFDASADGYVRGEGCGVVILERQADAIRRGDRLLALIRGSAVSQDGQSNSLTAPSGLAQRAVIRRALAAAGLPPEQVGYVEAHGTGTSLGDPIEVGALTSVYGGTGPGAPVWVGSVKTNIGHLEAAAGIAGFIKLVLSLRHGLLPAHLHLRQLNPYISLDGTRLRIPEAAQEWPAGPYPRAGAVSSFGFGGTNAHVIATESAESADPPPRQREHSGDAEAGWYVLPVSAKTRSALLELTDGYAGFLSGPPGRDLPLAAVCHTAGARRDHHRHRLAVLATSPGHAAELLRRYRAGDAPPGVAAGMAGTRTSAFLFAGQGAQAPGMAEMLYAEYALFRDVVDRCDELVAELLGRPLRPTICGTPGEQVDLGQTRYAQPAMFVTGYAIASLWQACGVRPDYLLGHSLGEYVAACVGGVLSAEDAIRLVVMRGQLMQDLTPPGAMYAVHAPERVLAGLREDVEANGDGLIAIAAENGPGHLVISGDQAVAADLAERYAAKDARVSRLAGTRAFHSPLIREAAPEFARYAGQIPHQPSRIPIISNVTGEVATIDPDYWVRQMLGPVRFGAGIQTLAARGCQTFVEAGPNPALTAVAAAAQPDASCLLSARRGDTDGRRFLRSLAAWYADGGGVDWPGLHRARSGNAAPAPGVVPLPAYPLRAQRYWYVRGRTEQSGTPSTAHPLLGVAADLAGTSGRWFNQAVTTARPWFLGQHRVLGAPVMPAAAIIEWALAAARTAAAGEAGTATNGTAQAWTLEGVKFGQLIQLTDDQPADLQAAADPSGEAIRLGCFSRVPGRGTGWTENATVAAARPAGPRTLPPDRDPAELRTRMTTRDIQDLYPRLHALGLDYGPAFRGLKQVWVLPGGSEALGLIEAGPAAGDAGAYVLHPVTLDACFHVAAAFLDGGETLWLPAGLGRITVYRQLPQRVWCHARAHGRQESEDFAMDLDILSESGECLAAIEGLRFSALPVAPESAPLRRYEVGWRELPDAAAPATPGTWLILGADVAAIRDWRSQLAEAGHTAIAVATGPGGMPPVPGTRIVNPYSESGVRRLFAELRAELPTVTGLILHGGPFRARRSEAATLRDTYRVARQMLLLKHFLAVYAAERPQVVICSAGAAMTRAADAAPDPAQSVLTGMARAITTEYPELTCVQADLEPGAAPPVLEVLSAAASLSGAGHIALRADRWYAARLRESELPGGDSPPVPIRPDGTYLITGGLGGLGQVVATWLADRGARSLLAVGRNVADPGPAQLTALRSRGVRVTEWQADVADPADVRRIIERAAAELPPIRGVVHAAGVSHDASLANLGWEQFRKVLDPKVRGAWHLHQQTAGLQLDFFVLFSSIASVTGSAGQSNYVVANAFLDCLARYRRHRGQTALSIGWGPWAQAGMAARADLLARLDSIGMASVPAGAALDALGRLLGSATAHTGLAAIAWHRFRGALGRRDPDTLLDGLLTAAPGTSHPDGSDRDGDVTARLTELAVTEPDAAREILLTELFNRAVELLGVSAADGEELRSTFRHMRFSELGFDSLLAVRLRNSILAGFSADVPPNDLLGQSTVLDAVELVLQQLAARNIIAADGDADTAGPGMEILTL